VDVDPGAGNEGQPACALLAVYDPDGGFVTGGGWISTAGDACQLDPACAGAQDKAHFGFVVRYLPHAAFPSGNTQLTFSEGHLSLHAQRYDWLVVAPDPSTR